MATIKEVAEYLGIPVATLYVWRHRGVGPKSYKLRGHVRYRWSEVDAWIEQQATDLAA